jgi:predicted metal-dependent hydrolase
LNKFTANRKIKLGDKEVVYCLKTSGRAKNLRVTVRPGGAVDVVRPRNLPEREAERFLLKKARWILDKVNKLKDKKRLLSGRRRSDFLRLRSAARKIILQKIREYRHVYGINIKRVAIRDQHTRWGSCSRLGNLNFNYRIALLPERLADYIVVHEICHLKEMNHSRRFWDLVALSIPDHKTARKELRRLC